jgi:Protein of unknown function (DUF1488)
MPLMHLNDIYDVEVDGIAFGMLFGDASVRCLIEDEAIRDAIGGYTTELQRIDWFRANRGHVESITSAKFDAGMREENGTIRVTTRDLNSHLYLPVPGGTPRDERARETPLVLAQSVPDPSTWFPRPEEPPPRPPNPALEGFHPGWAPGPPELGSRITPAGAGYGAIPEPVAEPDGRARGKAAPAPPTNVAVQLNSPNATSVEASVTRATGGISSEAPALPEATHVEAGPERLVVVSTGGAPLEINTTGSPPSAGTASIAINNIPPQERASTQFQLDADGRIDLVRDPPLGDAMQRLLFGEMRLKAADLAGLGHNQLAELKSPIDRFLAALPNELEQVSITRLWSRGNTLRRRLQAHRLAVASDEPSDPARLAPAVAEMLSDLVDTFNVFIVGDPTGRELDQVRLGPQERHVARVIVDAALPIVEAARMSEGLATPLALEALTEEIEAARDAPAGIEGDQAVDLSRKTSSNFVVTLLRSAYARVRAEPEFAWREYRAGIYRGLGTITAAGIASWPIIAFIGNNAEALKVFVAHAFNNPTLIQIIDLISNSAVR